MPFSLFEGVLPGFPFLGAGRSPLPLQGCAGTKEMKLLSIFLLFPLTFPLLEEKLLQCVPNPPNTCSGRKGGGGNEETPCRQQMDQG